MGQRVLIFGTLLFTAFWSYPSYSYYDPYAYQYYYYYHPMPVYQYAYPVSSGIGIPYHEGYTPNFPAPAPVYNPPSSASSSSAHSTGRATRSSSSSSSRSSSSVSSSSRNSSDRQSGANALTSGLAIDGLPCFSWVWCPRGE